MKEVKIADKNHPDYKKYEEKADEYKKHYDEKLENLWSLNLSPKEKDREFCKIHRKFIKYIQNPFLTKNSERNGRKTIMN